MKDVLDVHRALLDAGVGHEIVHLRRPVLAADDIPDAAGLPARRCVAVRLYEADGRLVAVLTRAGAVPHPAALLAAVRAQTLTSVPPEAVSAATDFAAGLVSPVLLPADLPVVADACLGASDVLYAATGDAGTALGIRSRDLLTASRAAATELCAPTPAALGATGPLDLTVERFVLRQHDPR